MWKNLATPVRPVQTSNTSLETYTPTPTTLHKESCHRLDYLVERQKQLCMLSDKMVQVIQTGAQQAVEECQYQFRNSRWNCSTVENSTDIFGGVLKFKSRESAFVHALSAAALAHAVARACSRGELNECSCDARVRKRTPRHWQWGGCSEKFSRDFVDVKEEKESDEGIMNLHNNEAGRRVVERKRGKNIRKLRPIHMDMKKPNKTDLTRVRDHEEKCRCRFVWCCRVHCDLCRSKRDHHVCN
uniref:Protein Wnt n=1 Tax=Heliconius erato TaxID=33431 RepID=L7X0N4_HELEA|nr:Wnt-4a-like protein [Heliconius erato]